MKIFTMLHRLRLRTATPAIYAGFFASGFAALIYENLWARHLALLLGGTAAAHTAVLCAFMGGLALGGMVLGRLADASASKLRFYALLNAAIALYAALTPLLFYSAQTLLRYSPDGSAGAQVWAACLLIVALPCFLMGGTLPALASLMAPLGGRGAVAAKLYYVNSAGAVLGSIAAGFVLIYRLGIDFPLSIGAMLNIAAGLLPFWAAPVLQERSGRAFASDEQDRQSPPFTPLYLGAVFFSGFTALVYELGWIRFFTLILGSSTYSFALMLAAFIAGLALGSRFIAAMDARIKRPHLWLAATQAGLGLCFAASLPFYDSIPSWMLGLSEIVQRTPEAFPWYQALGFSLCFAVMLAPTFIFGMVFPLAVRCMGAGGAGEQAGKVCFWNSLGNLLGAALAGLWILPLLGLQRLFEAGALLNAAAGAWLLWKLLPSRRAANAALGGLLAVCALYAAAVPRWDERAFTGQIFRRGMGGGITADRRILFRSDDADASVALVAQGGILAMFINGKVDATNGPDMPTQIMLAHVPLLLASNARTVLNIGHGSGVTCGSVLKHPIKKLDTVEISPAVVAASRFYDEISGAPLQDSRTRLFVSDAGLFVKRGKQPYDIIINEPSKPWAAGIGNLFSLEFYRACRERLAPDGIMAQWLHTSEMDSDTFRLILRTFSAIFPDSKIWTTGANDILLVGAMPDYRRDLEASRKRFALEPVSRDLARAGVESFEGFAALELAGEQAIRAYSGTGLINSERFPLLEHMAPLALFMKSNVDEDLRDLDRRRQALCGEPIAICEILRARPLGAEQAHALYRQFVASKSVNFTMTDTMAYAWHARAPRDQRALAAAAHSELLPPLRRLAYSDPAQYARKYAQALINNYSRYASFASPELFTETESELLKVLALAKKQGPQEAAAIQYLLGGLYFHEGDRRKALEYFDEAAPAIGADLGPGLEERRALCGKRLRHALGINKIRPFHTDDRIVVDSPEKSV